MKIQRTSIEKSEMLSKSYREKSLVQLQSIILKWAYGENSDKMQDDSLHPKFDKYLIFLVDTDEHLDKKYRKIGTATRTEFESKAKSFVIGALLKDERRKANMTQEELAEKTGTKKSYISRVENGHTDIQLSTLYN